MFMFFFKSDFEEQQGDLCPTFDDDDEYDDDYFDEVYEEDN